jgi:hypothetical protein
METTLKITEKQVLTYKPVKNLLAKGSTNSKTAKNNLETFIMYLAPFTLSGINVCQKATIGCIKACLFLAGMGVYSNVIAARINKTLFYKEDRTQFCTQLYNELLKLSNKATKQGTKIAIRLNGTSDLDFIGIIKNRLNVNILDLPGLIFYDYTKILGKALKYKNVQNYVVTFSRSEDNWNDCINALTNGINVAVVFDNKQSLPNTFLGFNVIDGDKSDDLMISNKGIILGLKAKGKAKKDTTGFVVRNFNQN